MNKQKTVSGIKNRFRLTKNGKLMRRKQNSRHLRMAKSKSQKRRMKEPETVSHGFAKKFIKIF